MELGAQCVGVSRGQCAVDAVRAEESVVGPVEPLVDRAIVEAVGVPVNAVFLHVRQFLRLDVQQGLQALLLPSPSVGVKAERGIRDSVRDDTRVWQWVPALCRQRLALRQLIPKRSLLLQLLVQIFAPGDLCVVEPVVHLLNVQPRIGELHRLLHLHPHLLGPSHALLIPVRPGQVLAEEATTSNGGGSGILGQRTLLLLFLDELPTWHRRRLRRPLRQQACKHVGVAGLRLFARPLLQERQPMHPAVIVVVQMRNVFRVPRRPRALAARPRHDVRRAIGAPRMPTFAFAVQLRKPALQLAVS
mmetsp:Transcript_87394/g.252324  ORF Transcript_87394/g.252324 Transcript_87394/m.252324 type:complete len:303 (+) Transcript_87394:644-1552(+)